MYQDRVYCEISARQRLHDSQWLQRKTECLGHQHGATLIIGLIMLLLLTLIGVAGIRDTTLQERMVGGERDRALAQQAAESALRIAEKTLPPTPAIVALTSTQLLRGGLSETAYWQKTTSWAGAVTVTGLPTASGLAESPKYVIEKMPLSYSGIDGTVNAGSVGATETVVDYRITARGVGSTTDAVVILQTMYRLVE
jgi:type IV pilus assembly protein PilX